MLRFVPRYKEQPQSRIIHGALQVFGEKGYHETTMADIAEMLGVSKGAIHLYFKSKEELFIAICETAPRVLRETLSSSFKNCDLLHNSERFVNEMLEQPTLAPNLFFELLAESSRSVSLKKVLKANHDSTREIVADFLREQRERGLIREDVDIPSLARGLVALYDGLMVDLTLYVAKSEMRRACKSGYNFERGYGEDSTQRLADPRQKMSWRQCFNVYCFRS